MAAGREKIRRRLDIPVTLRPLVFALLVFVCGCPAVKKPRPAVTRPEDAMRSPAAAVRLADDGDLPSLRAAIGESLSWLEAVPADRRFVYGPRTLTAAEVKAGLATFLQLLADDPAPDVLEARVRERFELLEAAGGEDGEVLFTGYYEPVIEAARTRDDAHRTPVFRRPLDLVEVPLDAFGERFAGERGLFGRFDAADPARPRVVPYWTRAEIAAGRLGGRSLEIAWAKDPVAMFFVEVQGSGALVFPDGTEERIGYAASNGKTYRSIGKLLADEGAIPREKLSLQSIRAWLAANPAHVDRVLAYNESYVFFRTLDGPPLGSLNRPVTPGRSIATDSKLFPHGGLAFIATRKPIAGESAEPGIPATTPLGRFVLNQDTGGAIRGAGRVDVFWGRGPDAEFAAGHMKEKGRLFFLVPRAAMPSP